MYACFSATMERVERIFPNLLILLAINPKLRIVSIGRDSAEWEIVSSCGSRDVIHVYGLNMALSLSPPLCLHLLAQMGRIEAPFDSKYFLHRCAFTFSGWRRVPLRFGNGPKLDSKVRDERERSRDH